MENRTCYRCNTAKDLRTSFPKNGMTKRGIVKYKYLCKDCDKIRIKLRDEKKGGNRGDKERLRLRVWVSNIKESLECATCGISFKGKPWLCDFHHKDPTQKEASIGQTVTYRWKEEEILKEIKKCLPLCANCHRIKHYEEKIENPRKRGKLKKLLTY